MEVSEAPGKPVEYGEAFPIMNDFNCCHRSCVMTHMVKVFSFDWPKESLWKRPPLY